MADKTRRLPIMAASVALLCGVGGLAEAQVSVPGSGASVPTPDASLPVATPQYDPTSGLLRPGVGAGGAMSPYGQRDGSGAPPGSSGGATGPGGAADSTNPANDSSAGTPANNTGGSDAVNSFLSDNSGGSTGQGGDVGSGGAAAATPFMVGDQGVFTQGIPARFPGITAPVRPGVPGLTPTGVRTQNIDKIVPSVRGFKIADNQSPRPIDRVFADFNYFDNVNASLNRRLGANINNQQVYHQLYGFEKTFLDQKASLGLRIPINSLFIDAPVSSGLRGGSTAAGNLNIFGKYVLRENRQTGDLLSAGLSLNVPTGPGAFAGFKRIAEAINPVQIQPFLGYIRNYDRIFLQGFAAVDVPTNSSLPTMLYIDNAIGYYLYRTTDRSRFLTAFTPAFEQHLNTPFNHRGYSVSDLYGIPDVLDLTFAGNFEFRHRSYLSIAYITPVTGPRPFSGELAVLFNFRFGQNRNRPGFVPVVGG